MPTLTQGQSVTLQMSEGESWTVTPTGQAQISTRGVSGGPLQAPTTIATATTFGPYAESGTLTIFAMTGSATYTGCRSDHPERYPQHRQPHGRPGHAAGGPHDGPGRWQCCEPTNQSGTATC